MWKTFGIFAVSKNQFDELCSKYKFDEVDFAGQSIQSVSHSLKVW